MLQEFPVCWDIQLRDISNDLLKLKRGAFNYQIVLQNSVPTYNVSAVL